MSKIRDYLYAKVQLPEGEWLRREPRMTHPEILSTVRAAQAEGLFYDDEIERYVETVAGDLPEHYHHGHDQRNLLTYQLGHEVYLAKGIIQDEQYRAELEAATTMGFTPLDETEIREGRTYLVRIGTLFGGQTVPHLTEPQKLKARRHTNTQGWIFCEPYKRHGASISRHSLLKTA